MNQLRRPPRGRLRWRAGMAVIGLSAALSGCDGAPAVGNAESGARTSSPLAGGGSSPAASPATPSPATTPAVPSPSAPTSSALAPLTGLPVASAAVGSRTVVGVPVLTGADRPPPEGIDRADLVYLSFPNPGRQRVLAMFQSQDSDRVGPVADTRPMDARLMTPFAGVLQHGGGTRGQVTRTDKSEVPQFSAVVHPGAFRQEANGALYGSTATARTVGGEPAREGLIPFRSAGASSPEPRSVTVSVPGQDPSTLAFDARTRTWAGSIGQARVRAANVIVQSVDYDTLTLARGAGTELDPTVVGDGTALVLTGDEVLDGTWNRPGRMSLTSYVGDDGVPVRLLPGMTVVVLAPPGTGVQRG